MSLFWTTHAWIDGRLQDKVLLSVDSQGFWDKIACGVQTPPVDALVLDGYVLPGMVNAHSHAFQRAFVGMTEQRSASPSDNFWSWRDQMYQVALKISPAQLESVATQLYREMLQGGYTQVCEFHYLHHSPDGSPYSDPLEMSWALVRAAKTAGIGLTLLPVLYERAGFEATSLRPDQRRFASSADSVWQMHLAIKQAQHPLVNAGLAIHSLRGASMASIQALHTLVSDADISIHIHISEQTGEVDDCLRVTGARPIEHLASHIPLDVRWQLVHATHASHAEINLVAQSCAALVMCPTTEANLGDGLTDMRYWLDAGIPLAIGSDSHVSRDWREELRWLEYGQRLQLRQRNVLASQANTSVAARLFNAAVQGGGRAAGFNAWGLKVGARADAVVLDASASGLQGVAIDYVLDAYVFGCDKSAVTTVVVAGQCINPIST
ncbi:MAG: formimidoylglutamate deiminase [Cytophagales bacterium]|nr:formimidoylglutamate deiminase [Cytophagales bacterium]